MEALSAHAVVGIRRWIEFCERLIGRDDFRQKFALYFLKNVLLKIKTEKNIIYVYFNIFKRRVIKI